MEAIMLMSMPPTGFELWLMKWGWLMNVGGSVSVLLMVELALWNIRSNRTMWASGFMSILASIVLWLLGLGTLFHVISVGLLIAIGLFILYRPMPPTVPQQHSQTFPNLNREE